MILQAHKYEDYVPIISTDHGIAVLNFIQKMMLLVDVPTSLYINDSNFNAIELLEDYNASSKDKLLGIINTVRLNDIRFINKYLEESNKVLLGGGILIGCVESSKQRKQRIFRHLPKPFDQMIYLFDLFFNRILPKLNGIKKIYFSITRGRNRLISDIELYGRLYSCGFELIQSKEIQGYLWFAGRKIDVPAFNKEATYGPIIKLKRHGKYNKTFTVYKLRTMYPFSEYLQEYISSKYGLQKGGKFKNDPRVTTAGRFFRKYWLDEIPMIVNFIKGDMKLLGVRPLSSHYLGLYPEVVKELRAKVKPGLIPPFYADLPETFEEIVASEEAYIRSYLETPISTDLRYFFRALYNIIIRRARSN